MHLGTILYYRTVPEQGDAWRATIAPLPCKMWPGWKGDEEIPFDFHWNGNSSGILAPIFPRHNHPIASVRHDFRCGNAENAEQRRWADTEFRRDVATTSWWLTAQVGYIGVRVGAMFGIGNVY